MPETDISPEMPSAALKRVEDGLATVGARLVSIENLERLTTGKYDGITIRLKVFVPSPSTNGHHQPPA